MKELKNWLVAAVLCCSTAVAPSKSVQAQDTDGLVGIIDGLLSRVETLEQEAADLRRDAIFVQSGYLGMLAEDIPSLIESSSCTERGIFDRRVTFPEPFASEPHVAVALDWIDIQGASSGDTNCLMISIKSKDETGFNYDFKTWCTTKVHGAGAVWIAYGTAPQ